MRLKLVTILVVTTTWLVGAQSAALKVDPTSSQITIQVGKSGAFSFAGHEHEVVGPASGGEVRLDEADLARSSVTLEFDAAKLRVTGKGEPAKDVPEAQSVMLGERVLDVKRFPTIAFKSRDVEVTRRTGDEATLLISGDLTLHGQTRPIKVAAQVMLGQGKVTSRGAFEIKQTAFGIKPVTAVGGTVRVKDELKISFVIVAMR